MKIVSRFVGLVALASVVGAADAWAEKTYDWKASDTYAVGKATSVSLPEDGELYLKLSGVKAGQPYTFIVRGGGASVAVVYTYNEDGDEWDDDLSTSEADSKTENQERCIVDSDAWIFANIVKDPEYEYEPGEWNEMKVTPKGYYLHVSGDSKAVVSLSSMNGVVPEPIPIGDYENPKMISPAATPATWKANFVDSAYYFYMGAKVGTYLLTTSGGSGEAPYSLVIDADSDAYSVTNVSSTVATEGNEAYLLKVTKAGRIDFCVVGLGSSFGLTHQFASAGSLGRVTVNMKGVDATWSIRGAAGTYNNGETVGILGAQTIVFSRVTGFMTPENQLVTPTEDNPEIEITGVYNDSYDPKDDVVSGATRISPNARGVTASRTLFEADEFDHFTFTAKDGVYYNFSLVGIQGDAVMSIFKKGGEEEVLSGPATVIAKFAPGNGDYIVQVAHADPTASVDAQYTLASSSANVGAISFARSAVSVKKSTGKVDLTVNRSQSEGKVRVRYGTVCGSALPGVDYVAQSGELVWEAGDKKAKTITIGLIPELFAEEALSRKFEVRLEPVPEDEIAADEYLATVTAGKDVAVVTVTETKARAAAAVRAATVKTETSALRTGTFYGVLTEDGCALTNGLPQLASVTLTVTAKTGRPDTLSAKVMLAGKTYNFKSDTRNPQEWEDAGDGFKAVTLTLAQTVNRIVYTNALTLTVRDGSAADDWSIAGGKADLVMNVPDANNKGVQEDIFYAGELVRDNAKVQDYLYAVTNAVGYYTISLVPSGVSNYDGIPAGNGYLTLTIDNKGKAKIAGMLADGSTRPSYSSVVAVRDGGDTLLVPVFVARSPYCFGGTLRLFRGEDGRYVVDSSVPLIWNNDNALLTYDGEEGWSIALEPIGGYFNTVNSLQAYYLTHAFSVTTADIGDLLTEALADEYSYVTSVQPNEMAISVLGNALSTERKSLVRVDGLYDLEQSINPCNVQVKLARATGLVSGSFSVWSENAEGKQREISNLKHYGVLLLSRDEASSLDPEVMTAGFFTQSANIKYTVTDALGRESTKTRKYTASMPFNLMAVDQGEIDWWADDWGWNPEWGEAPAGGEAPAE